MKKQNTEDIGEVLQKVEKSFRFQFGKTELKEVKTFGDLCDIITSKVQGDNFDDCTTQQAFYKLRNAIATILFIDTNSLTVGTNLHELFPRQQRRRQIKELEKALHIQTKALRPKNWITITFVLLLIASFIGLFIFWKVGLVGLVFSFAGLKISDSARRRTFLEVARDSGTDQLHWTCGPRYGAVTASTCTCIPTR